MDDVSLETRRELHWSALRALRRSLLWRGGLLVLSIVILLMASPNGPHTTLFVTAALLATAQAGWEYWRHARRDPDGPVANPDEDRAAERAERDAIKQRLAERRAPLTLVLIAVLIAIGVAELALARTSVHAANIAGLLKTPGAGSWRAVSATFLHANIVHLLFNVVALFVLGRLTEGYLPRWRLPLAYAVAAVAGSAASLLFEPRPSIGASGAIMGLAGCLFAASLGTGARLPPRVRLQVWTLVALNLIAGAASAAYVDNAAHLGGFIGGAAIGWGTERLAGRGSGAIGRALDGLGVIAAALLLIGAFGTTMVLARHRVTVTPDVRVSSVSATIERAGSGFVAHVRNRGDHALEAYRLEVRVDRRIVETVWRDDCCFPASPQSAPVPAHGDAWIPLAPMNGGVSVTPPVLRVTIALFDDGSYEGLGRELELMQAQRRETVGEAAFWLETLATARERPAPRRGAWLAAVAEQHEAGSAIRRPAAVALGIHETIARVRESPGRFDELAAEAARHIEASRAQLLARLVTGNGTIAASERRK
jgi:membrane associated rhomboid family serine protease